MQLSAKTDEKIFFRKFRRFALHNFRLRFRGGTVGLELRELTDVLQAEHDREASQHRQERDETGPVFREDFEENDIQQRSSRETLHDDVKHLQIVCVGSSRERGPNRNSCSEKNFQLRNLVDDLTPPLTDPAHG